MMFHASGVVFKPGIRGHFRLFKRIIDADGFDSPVKNRVQLFHRQCVDFQHLLQKPNCGNTSHCLITQFLRFWIATDANAHPHRDCSGRLALIHNGIIENYLEIKERLLGAGHTFTSETDTEVLAHLIEERYSGDLVEAVRSALNDIRGAYAIGVMHLDHPDRIVGARMNVPLIVGLGNGEGFLASDVPAILEHTKNVVILQEGDIADVTSDGVAIIGLDGSSVERPVTRIRWSIEAAEKGGFPHFTLKEIYEQPHAIQEALRGRVDTEGNVSLIELDAIEEKLKRIERVYVVGCGTARYAGEVGAHLIQSWSGLPASGQIGSEMRYSPPPIDERTLVISVSQSGETADTLAPQKLAAERGAVIVVVTNVVGSAITREADAVCYLQAGPEVAVASTKAFVTQVVVLEMIALHLARLRGTLTDRRRRSFGLALRELPAQAAEALKLALQIKKIARRWDRVRNVMFIGRALGYPIAMEGALKLKELSYVHAEGYAAGELKHGPIALLDPQTPLVAIATRGATYEKVVSNVAEVRAREAPVLAVATVGDEEIDRYAQDVLYVPETLEEMAPVIAILPLQLLAYEVAVARGTDVDQPRNLAKSVTVE